MNKLLKKLVKEYKSRQYIDLFLLFTITIFVYIHHLSPSVYGGDSGDFITAALTRGVPHPSGYPLYTMLGIIFTSLPIPFTPAWKLGLVSALFSSLSLVILYKIIYELTNNRCLSIITSLTLAFTYPFWLYAEIVEVIPLNSFFILTLIYFTIKYIGKQKPSYLSWLSFFVGLSLTNNLSIILLFPGIFFALLLTSKKIFTDYKTLIKLFIFLVLGLTPYLYIPIAANNNPLVNWGKAVNFKNFLYLVLRKDYGWFPAEKYNIDIILTRLSSYIDYIKIYINPLIPIIALIGLIYLTLKKDYKLFVLFFVSYLLLGPFILIYPQNPLESFLTIAVFEKFYIAGFIILIILLPLGIILIRELILTLLKNKTRVLTNLLLITFAIIPISLFITNFKKTNLRNVFIGDNFGVDILAPLPEKSVVLMTGDTNAFNALYLQIAYGLRHDIYIPGRYEGFRYILKESGLTESEIEDYMTKNRTSVEQKIIYPAIGPLLTKNSIFSDGNREIVDYTYGRILSVPYGLLYKLEFETDIPSSVEEYLKKVEPILTTYHLEDFEKHGELVSNNLILADIKMQYSLSYFNIANFIAEKYGDLDVAKFYLEKSIELDPTKK